jgi:pimeloyl-ACP methyl ester carboxylesterase
MERAREQRSADDGRRRTRSTVVSLAVVVAVALVAVGCGEDRDDAGAGTPSDTTVVEAPATTGGREGETAGLDWGPCEEQGDAYECATLAVPLDYDAPDGPTMSIAVIRHPATDPDARIGSVVYNPGGPGGAGVPTTAFLIDNGRIPDELLARFDFVSFDPRGVGSSDPIDCHPNLWDTIAVDASPDDPEAIDEMVEINQVLADACVAEDGEVIGELGTMNVAQDMDRLREALGDDQLTYLGMSYGTRLGATYAELFPEKVRAMVLDGSVEPDATLFSFREGQAPGFEQALTTWFTWCDEQGPDGCALAPGAEARFDAIVAELDGAPMFVEGDDRPVTANVLRTVAGSQLYFADQFESLGQLLAQVEEGDASGVLEAADTSARGPDGEYTNLVEVNAAINCADFADRPTVDEVTEFARELREQYPRMGGPSSGWTPLVCTVWGADPDPVPTFTGRGAGPIVVIGSTGDPATPFDWSTRMAAALEDGVHLVREGAGHTSYGTISACIDEVVDRYLIDLVVPDDGTTCPTD